MLKLFTFSVAIFCCFSNSSFAQPKVIVIGAGLSGLTTAYRLHQAGYDVEVYEARKRAGGRVFSVRVGGEIEELGGKDLSDGGDATSILGLAKELHLSVSSSPATHLDQYFDPATNKVIDPDLIDDGFPMLDQAMLNRISEIQARSKNLGEFIDSFFAGYPLRRQIYEIRVVTVHGVGSDQVTALDASEDFLNLLKVGERRRQEKINPNSKEIKHEEVPLGFQFLSIDGGNARLIQELVKRLEGRVHFQTLLKGIKKSQTDAFSLTFQKMDGAAKKKTTIEADQLVLTVPISTFPKIVFEKGIIPLEQKNKINQLRYSEITKILLRVYSTENVSGIGTFESGISWLTKQKSVLTLYYGGRYGKEYLTKDLSKRLAKDEAFLHAIYPGMTWQHGHEVSVPQDEQFSSYESSVGLNWARDPYSLGAYSYLPAIGGDDFEKTVKICGEETLAIFQPIQKKLFFAGEHTSLELRGTMEGAVESGERTAKMFKNCVRIAS